MSGKNTTVYQVENTIDTFLNTKIQFWAEPNIISKQIINICRTTSMTEVVFFYKKIENYFSILNTT